MNRRRPASRAAFFGALACCIVLGCSSPPAVERGGGTDAESADRAVGVRPDILLITACTCRYDHLSPAGYARPTTPFLQDLARSGVFFENAVSASSWTKASARSLEEDSTFKVPVTQTVSKSSPGYSRPFSV